MGRGGSSTLSIDAPEQSIHRAPCITSSRLREQQSIHLGSGITLPDRGEYNHSIRLRDPNIKPVKRPAIPLKPLQARKMKERLDELLQANLIRRSQSSWGLPAFMVSEDGGADMRMVVDYQPLNKHVIKNANSLPHIKELVARLSRAKVFSKLDLKSGYTRSE